MRSARLVLAFGAVAAAALVGTLPLRLALDLSGAARAGLSARQVDGTLWGGTLQDARLRAAPLGEVRAAWDPLAAASGGRALRLTLAGPVTGEAGASLSPGGMELRDADLTLPLEWALRASPFRGRLALEDVAVSLKDGRCRSASGGLRIDDIRLATGAPVLEGLSLGGRLACRDGVLVIPFSGGGEAGSVGALVRIDGAGRYQVETTIRAADPALEAAFGLAGFPRTLDGFSRTDRGELGRLAAAPAQPPMGP